MEDLRQKIEDLNALAEEQKEQKARINGKIDMPIKSLKDLGLTTKTATADMAKLKKVLLTDNKKLEKMVKEIQDKYGEELEN